MYRVIFLSLLAFTFSCAEQPAAKKKKKKQGSENLLGSTDDPNEGYPGGATDGNGNGTQNGNDDDDGDDDGDGSSNNNARTWQADDGTKWAMLPEKLNWCSASDIDIEKDEDSFSGIDLQNPSIDGLSGILATFKDSTLGECLEEEGSGTKKGDLDDPSGGLLGSVLSGGGGGLSGILSGLSGGNNPGVEVGDKGDGCKTALGSGWRLPTLDEMEDVDAEALIKAIPDAEDREFWTSTTVEPTKATGTTGTNGTGGTPDLTSLLSGLGGNTGGFDISSLLNSGNGGGLDLGSLEDGPIGAFTYELDREKEDTAGKQAARNVLCIND